MQHPPLRLGILGLARIATGGIIPAAARTEAVEVAAIATRGGGRKDEIQEAAPGAGVFEDYGSLLQSDEIEAVYIPLPNSLHVEWTLRAIEAGKHVLCEKPFSLDAAEAEGAVGAASEAGLTLMEGFMYRLHPQSLRLRELIESGSIGTVRHAVAEFGHRLDDPEDVRGVGTLGGGSLGDVGCYCISGLRLAFGSEPQRVAAFARFDGDGADLDFAGTLEFDEGLGVVSCSISSSRRERLEITGTEGILRLEAPFRPDKAGGSIEILHGDESTVETFEADEPYRRELEEFAAAVREDREPAVGPQEMLGNSRALSALLRSSRESGQSSLVNQR